MLHATCCMPKRCVLHATRGAALLDAGLRASAGTQQLGRICPTPRLPRTLTLKALICAIDSALTACCEGRGPCGGRGLVAHTGHEQSQGTRANCSNKELRIAAIAGAERGKQRHDENTHALRAAGRGCVSKATCHSHGACCRRCCLPQQCQTDCASCTSRGTCRVARWTRPHLMLCVASHAEKWCVAYSRASAIPTGHRWAVGQVDIVDVHCHFRGNFWLLALVPLGGLHRWRRRL